MRQRIVVAAGPPAGGKTSVMLHVIGALQAKGQQVAVSFCMNDCSVNRYRNFSVCAVT